MSYYGKRTLNDAYLVFATMDEYRNYIAHNTSPLCKIYAKDYVNFSGSKDTRVEASNKRNTLSIITNSPHEIEIDYVLFDIKYGIKWRVESVTIDDNNQEKGLKISPNKWQILNLKK